MGILVQLVGDRPHHLGMAVPDIEHAYPPSEVDEAVALDIPDLCVLRPVDENRSGRGDAARGGALAASEEIGVRGHGRLSRLSGAGSLDDPNGLSLLISAWSI